MKKIIIILISAGLFGGLVFVSLLSKKAEEQKREQVDTYSIVEPSEINGEIGDHVIGKMGKDKKVIIEYADFQCQGCASVSIRMKKLLEKMGDKIVIVYRNYLISYHKNATAAASAAEAAGLQGYWQPYADLLFANQNEWSDLDHTERGEKFVSFFVKASQGKGDIQKFKQDLTSQRVQKKIKFDGWAGDKVGVTGTPSIFYKDKKIDFSKAKSEDEFIDLFKNL